MEYKDFVEVFQPVEMEDTFNKLNEALNEYPKEFIRRVNGRVLELKFHKPNAYSVVECYYAEGDVFVVNKNGVIYIAGNLVESSELITFGDHQFPGIYITQLWKN